MSMTFVESDLDTSLDALEQAIEQFQSADFDQLSPEKEPRVVGRLEARPVRCRHRPRRGSPRSQRRVQPGRSQVGQR